MKKKFFVCLPLALMMSLTGCDKASVSNNTDTNTAVQPDNDQDVSFEAVPVSYQLPKEVASVCKEEANFDSNEIGCPKIDVSISKIKPKWIQDDLNLAITKDNNPEMIKFRRGLDSFSKSQLDGGSLAYTLTIKPEFVGKHNNVVQFSVLNDEYLGGAHGVQSVEYFVYDLDLGSKISINDIENGNYEEGMPTLMELAHNSYRGFLATEQGMNPEQIAEHEEAYPFEMTENFHFSDKGLVLTYVDYQLSPYAMGPVILEIGYDKLQHLLRPEYLPKT